MQIYQTQQLSMGTNYKLKILTYYNYDNINLI